jgi:RHH-type transcriptional regulator, proline utilization regulon repressor / proline dehydrogenase / delta 1-pyrroline-5-carboxylate dehydrogenase
MSLRPPAACTTRPDAHRNGGFDLGLDPVHDEARAAIAGACRGDEAAAVRTLLSGARLSPEQLARTQTLATRLAEAVRAERVRAGGVDALMVEFSLDSDEGVALMCLAEALLRIPDDATRDRLIRDKLGGGAWATHVGASPSLFVNAAAWGLLVTGKLVDTRSEGRLERALSSLLRKGGEPLIRLGVDLAIRLLGRQFVTGRTIDEALVNAREREARGYTFSYDMLGEAALTSADAQRYFEAYQAAIHAIGRAAAGRGVVGGPGISVKLSALHPRYSRAQRERVRAELTPRLLDIAQLARHYDIGLNLDAEEADRLDLSLDLLARLAADPSLEGWAGLGFVVQAYQKRAPLVIDWLTALARTHRRRLMVRLVKGAYWDSEIKRAQVDGLSGYPVYTRKVHTDVAYLACAKALLAAPDAIYPQFASHNAYTIAAIHTLAGDARYEFQCLHGMGESIYDEVVGPNKLGRGCRIYAPVGSHETLLGYLVRRLLENGANTSFVNRIADPAVSIAALVADPVADAQRTAGAPHGGIPLPEALLPGRVNSRGLDLADDVTLDAFAGALRAASGPFTAAPMLGDAEERAASGNATADPAAAPGTSASVADRGIAKGACREIRNPADLADLVGTVVDATSEEAARAVTIASTQGGGWAAVPARERAACLERAAELMEGERATLCALAVREAGKTLANAIGEVREAVDFCRYYAAWMRREAAASGVDQPRPIGPVVAISPWNFPLAIFVGQVSAALAAGNPVLAKPAEQTSLMAAAAVRLFHRAGVLRGALQLVPGPGETVGAALVADPRIAAVIFTGSTEVARLINRQLAQRDDAPVLIAETGGQNAMIVDSSALPEQVVADALASAFDSAGQRCSALRVLCVQDDIADTVLAMLDGAMRELVVGDPRRLATDIGPVIDAAARGALRAHIDEQRLAGRPVSQLPLPDECDRGTFVAPAVIDLGGVDGLGTLTHEVFGPVLHVVRWRRDALPALIDAINATGYGLTHGIHTRIDETVATILARVRAGNVYVNRNMIGAVVGVQPFGGHGLSGTGPKAGGPLYVARLIARAAATTRLPPERRIELPGPTGESNCLDFLPRGLVACIAADEHALVAQAQAAISAGNTVLLLRSHLSLRARDALDPSRVVLADTLDPARVDLVLLDASPEHARRVRRQLAAAPGRIVPIAVPDAQGRYDETLLVIERTVTVNTAATGGNAALLSLAE